MHIKKLISAVLAGIMILAMTACGSSSPDKVVASVNDVEITQGYVDQFISLYTYAQGTQTTELTTEDKQSMLEELVDMEVMKQYMDAKGEVVIDDKAEAEIADYITAAHESVADYLTQSAITDDTLRNFYVTQYYSSAFFSEFSVEMADVDMEAKAKEYYESHKEDYKIDEEQVRASHILVATAEEAQNILDQLNAGADFAELAKKYSTDGSAADGGDLGFFVYGDMVQEFSDVAFATEVGKISGIVQSENGYHIIKVTDKRPAGEYKAMEDVFNEIYYAVYQAEYEKKIDAIKADMDIKVGKVK